jgi:phage shock protein A
MGKITPLFGDKAGEPTKDGADPILTGLIGEMTEQIIAAKNQVSESRKEVRRLARQAEMAAKAAEEWEQRAMSAVRAGDDVVARDALLRKRQQELECERFRAAEKDQNEQTSKLTRALSDLNFRVEEAKHKRNSIITRAERAAALPAMDREAAVDREGADADEMLKRLEAKMTDIETELELSDEAIANLAREAGDALRAQGELARLKREAGDPARAGSMTKPLAKTVPDSESRRPSAPQAVGVSGPERTKR